MALKRGCIDDTLTNCKKLKAYAPEGDFINYLSVPSLESMSIVSIVTALFKQSDVITAIQKHSVEFNPVNNNCFATIRGTAHDKSFYEIEKKILDRVVFLQIPNLLKVKICSTVIPIQLQILSWIRHSPRDMEYINAIFWSSEGTIDKIKTYKHLIKSKEKGQNIKSCYELACKHCLEENIHSLWNKLPEKDKNNFLSGTKDVYEDYEDHLLAYWTHIIGKDMSRFMEQIRRYDNKNLYNYDGSIYKNMFKLALFTNNILAVKYFWYKLTYAEMNCNLINWVQLTVNKRKRSGGSFQKVQENADILYFLLSKMNGCTEQKEILQNNSDVILNSLFLDWPWQRFLLPTINLLWEHIDEKLYVDLLNNITQNIKERSSADNVLSRLWSNSPEKFKKHFIQYVLASCQNTNIFCNLLLVEKVRAIKAILKYADIKDQREIVFSLVENQYFINVVRSDKLFSFDDLCPDILEPTDMKCIKDKIVLKHGNDACQKWIESDKWDKVESFLNWAFNAEEQIKHFKNEVIQKVEITYSLIFDKDNYEYANKFLSWCFESEEDIHRFKIHFSKSKPEIVEIGCEEWSAFEKFLNWCFESDKEIQNFKVDLSSSHKIKKMMYSCIAYGYQFEFVENVINWCCTSQEKLKKFKANLALSNTWMRLLQRFVSNYKIHDSDSNNWDLIKKLFKLVSPLDGDIINKIKEKISLVISYDHFRADFKKPSYKVKKENLFRLLDKYKTEREVHNVSNLENDIELVLNEVLNKVESNLQSDD